MEREVLVGAFSELRAGMIVRVRNCVLCSSTSHRGILTNYCPDAIVVDPDGHNTIEPAFDLLPDPHIDDHATAITPTTVADRIVYRVVSGLEAGVTTQRKQLVRA